MAKQDETLLIFQFPMYNLRKTQRYRQQSKTYTKTQARQVNIGERRKPNTNGEPGYLRVDTVHQGDLDGEKGMYHINAVDEEMNSRLFAAFQKSAKPTSYRFLGLC